MNTRGSANRPHFARCCPQDPESYILSKVTHDLPFFLPSQALLLLHIRVFSCIPFKPPPVSLAHRRSLDLFSPTQTPQSSGGGMQFLEGFSNTHVDIHPAQPQRPISRHLKPVSRILLCFHFSFSQPSFHGFKSHNVRTWACGSELRKRLARSAHSGSGPVGEDGSEAEVRV